jgi:hypothetical protein
MRTPPEAVDPESPLRLPLVRQMLTDPTVRLQARAVDARWHDEGVLRTSIAGFNPFVGAIFRGRSSAFDLWLQDPTRGARPFNHKDRLLRSLLFSVHDYIHVWATRLMQRLAPELGFGLGRVTADNFDDQLFCMLLSEAAASVGVDYWWLCAIDLGEALPIGTRVRGGLTTSYHERDRGEYRRFHPELDVQSLGFFGDLCGFYCTGEFVGFDADDLARSPLLLAWLTQELRYGERQREICRSWLAHLADGDLVIPEEQLTAPLDTDARGRPALVAAVGEALWRKVKQDEMQAIPAADAPPVQSPAGRAPDFRFRNANAVDDDELFAPASRSAEEFEHLFAQVVSRCDYGAFDRELLKLFPTLLEKRDPGLLRSVLRGQPRLPPGDAEPRDLLVLN